MSGSLNAGPNEPPIAADALVMFGITGDLARKKLFSSLYRLEADEMLDCKIIGVASSDWTREELIGNAREALDDLGLEKRRRGSGDRFERRRQQLFAQRELGPAHRVGHARPLGERTHQATQHGAS